MSLRAAIDGELAALDGSGLRLFDIHSHTGADVDGSARSAEQHVATLERFDARSAIFPFHVDGPYEAENRRVLAEARRHPRLVPFARLDPRVSGGGEAAEALAAGARGIKLHPRSEEFSLDLPSVDAILGAAAEVRAPVLIHAGAGVGSFGPIVVELAARHRDCPIVLAHAAVSDLVWLGELAGEHPNLFFDTAWWNPSDLLALFALVAPGQILFGSDEPFMSLDLVLAIALRCARFAGLSAEALTVVFGAQAEALLAGAEPLDAGPAPGPRDLARTPAEDRLATLLAAAGGCMLGGGDPTQILELARVAVVDGRPGGATEAIGALVEEALAGSPEGPWAVGMALTLAATPGVEARAALV